VTRQSHLPGEKHLYLQQGIDFKPVIRAEKYTRTADVHRFALMPVRHITLTVLEMDAQWEALRPRYLVSFHGSHFSLMAIRKSQVSAHYAFGVRLEMAHW
jgi:hypothetical protein